MCMIEDADYAWTLLADETPRARKAHRCDECGRTIRPGETYRKIVGVSPEYDGLDKIKQCAHCQAAATWLQEVCGGYLYGQIREDLEQHWSESPDYRSPTLRALIDGMRRGWSEGAEPVPDPAIIRQNLHAQAVPLAHPAAPLGTAESGPGQETLL